MDTVPPTQGESSQLAIVSRLLFFKRAHLTQLQWVTAITDYLLTSQHVIDDGIIKLVPQIITTFPLVFGTAIMLFLMKRHMAQKMHVAQNQQTKQRKKRRQEPCCITSTPLFLMAGMRESYQLVVYGMPRKPCLSLCRFLLGNSSAMWHTVSHYVCLQASCSWPEALTMEAARFFFLLYRVLTVCVCVCVLVQSSSAAAQVMW